MNNHPLATNLQQRISYYVLGVFAAMLMSSQGFSQALPDISYRDYGYTKPVNRATKMYYSIAYASDGSIKAVEEVEKVIQIFNADGNIESYENQSFLDDSWAKSQSIYKNKRIQKQFWTHSNAYLNRTYTYIFNKQNNLAEEKIRFKDGSKSYIKFHYTDSLLSKIEADIDGTYSITERYYSAKGKLYKEIHQQKVPRDTDIVTNYFYLEDKEILSFVEPQSYFYATAYLKDAMGFNSGEIKFKLLEDLQAQNNMLKGIKRFEQEAPLDQLPFDLQAYSEQTLQAFEKNKNELKPYRMVLYLRNKNNDIMAEAEVDLRARKIAGIGFFETAFSDGTMAGTTDFRYGWLHIFVAMLQQNKLP